MRPRRGPRRGPRSELPARGGGLQRQCAPTYPAGSGAWHRAGFALGEGLWRGVDAATLHPQATQQRDRPWAAADAAEAARKQQLNGRQRRSNEHAAENHARRAKAEAMRLRNVFSRWHQQCRRRTPQDAVEAVSPPQLLPGATPPAQASATLLPPPPVSPIRPPAPSAPSDADTCTAQAHQQVSFVRTPLLPPPPPPPPAPAASPPPPMPSQQQGGEQMQCERAKNARRRSPAADASPVGAHARVRKLELPPPPSSAPPSPPLSTTPLSSPASSAPPTPTIGHKVV